MLMPSLVDKVKPISDKPDDLFICAAGPESTCLDSMMNAYENQSYYPKFGVVLMYDMYKKAGMQTSKDSNHQQAFNFRHLSGITHKLIPGKVQKLYFSRSKPHENHYNIRELLKQNSLLDNIANVTIDSTSILDQDIFSILHLVDKPGTNVRVLYSKPPKGKLPLSEGYIFTSVLPGFQGEVNHSGTYNHVAAILCGYEPHKAMVLKDKLRSRYTYFIFPKPSFHKGWDYTSKRLHKNFLIVRGDSKILEASGLDPLDVKSVLDNIYNTHQINHEDLSLRHYMQVALAGCTKLQTIGAYLFVRSKIGEKDNLSYSPVGVYYAVSTIPSVIKGPGELVEFMLPKKSQ